MATANRDRRRLASDQYRSALHPLPSRHLETSVEETDQKEKEIHQRKKSRIASEKKDWEDAKCAVCLEYPHNAVLLLCSSHDKGCRPYMCGTSYRYSNCLEQFKKAYTKVVSPPHVQSYGSTNNSNSIAGIVSPDDKCEVMEFACPLCRGKVKGMTVVEPAREYLNAKRRGCTQDNCSFMGTYNEIRKHVKQEHPCTRPQAVDPVLEEKWKRLEREREHDDVMSTIRSSMPGALVLGDYVIEGHPHSSFNDGEAAEDSDRVLDDDSLFDLFSFFREYTRAESTSLTSRLGRLRRIRRLQRGFRLAELDEVEGESLEVPASTAAGSAATTLLSSEEDNNEYLIGRHHRGRSQRSRRSRSE